MYNDRSAMFDTFVAFFDTFSMRKFEVDINTINSCEYGKKILQLPAISNFGEDDFSSNDAINEKTS